jgi:L,D-peptidoglycan transpeptidase YkuD (ErfK/YbiS/YcfS/YnhG family)
MLQSSQLKKVILATLLLASIIGFCRPVIALSAESTCPAELLDATRLILVVASDMKATTATVRLMERPSKDAQWNEVGEVAKGTLGRAGIGWSWAFESFARLEEPIKHEGDGRTPAGFFRVGRPFGFEPGAANDYVQLEKGKTFCVNDVRSRYYNTIMPKAQAGDGTTGEDMGRIFLYRHGLFIEYPTSRERKGGSCIFIHVWRSPASPTSGCVALAEDNVINLQKWTERQRRPTLLGIVSQAALNRLQSCFSRSGAN